MQVFVHHLYELKKGLRKLILHTTKAHHKAEIETRLKRSNVAYRIEEIGNGNINIFFGRKECIDVLQKFSTLNLSQISDEEDFILGTMLGYDVAMQCERYVERREKAQKKCG